MTSLAIVQQRLHNQHLLGAPFARPDEVVQWFGAVQAQEYPGATWGIAQRTDGLTQTAIDQAFADGAILRTPAMRPTWQQDDILSTRLTGPYDLIFDRGCFHVLPPERRPDYAITVAGLLKSGGYLFLKCFSQLQPGAQGPHRFTPEQIREIFSSRLQVRSVTETVYQGTLDPLPRALFCTMRREG